MISDSRTSDLVMSLLQQNDILAERSEVKGIVIAEKILFKGLEKLSHMIELGTTPQEELALQWQGINRFIDLYVKRKEELVIVLEATNDSNPCSNDLLLLKTIGFGDDNDEEVGIVHFNHDILIDIAHELANKAKNMYGRLSLTTDKVIRTGPSTKENIENNRKPSTDDQNLMNFEKTARESLLKTSQNTTNEINAADTPLTSKGKKTPKPLGTRTFTDQLDETSEEVSDQNLRYKMEQEIEQLKKQLEQKLLVNPLNVKPPVKSTYQADNEELRSKKRLTAKFLSTIMKIQRTIEDVKEFQTYINLHDGENSMDLLINLDNES